MSDKTPAQHFLTRSTRVYIYKIVAATAPLLVALGMITEGVAQNVLEILGAVLTLGGVGVALRNVSDD